VVFLSTQTPMDPRSVILVIGLAWLASVGPLPVPVFAHLAPGMAFQPVPILRIAMAGRMPVQRGAKAENPPNGQPGHPP